MHEYDMEAGGLAIRVEHWNPVFAHESARLLLGAYVPGVRFIQPGTGEKTDMRVIWQQAGKAKIRRHGICNGGAGCWITPKVHGDSLLDLLNVTYSMARLCWLNKGLYPVHSACIGPNGRGHVLCIGHSGSGKTAVTLNLAKKGWEVFSGNKTLVSIQPDGSMRAIAGTRTITTKAADAARHVASRSGNLDYQDRTAFTLGGAGDYSQAPSVNIKAIALVRLNDGAQEYARIRPASALHRLYPFFMDTVYADTVIGDMVFNGTPPKETGTRLVQKLAPALVDVPTFTVSGSMQFVTKSLMQFKPLLEL